LVTLADFFPAKICIYDNKSAYVNTSFVSFEINFNRYCCTAQGTKVSKATNHATLATADNVFAAKLANVNPVFVGLETKFIKQCWATKVAKESTAIV
jgi:hypothetical protein